MQTLAITSLSKSQVSHTGKCLDDQVATFISSWGDLARVGAEGTNSYGAGLGH